MNSLFTLLNGNEILFAGHQSADFITFVKLAKWIRVSLSMRWPILGLGAANIPDSLARSFAFLAMYFVAPNSMWIR